MAEEVLRARFGKKIVDHNTYVIAGDGCLMEGVSQEAISLAGRHALSKLIVLVLDGLDVGIWKDAEEQAASSDGAIRQLATHC